MKHKAFSAMLRASSLFALAFALAAPAAACGPYYPIIPTPKFFTSTPGMDLERQENIRLWQKLTSERVPARDIEEAVYKDGIEKMDEALWDGSNTKNLFYIYLKNSNDEEAEAYLRNAKKLEKARAKTTSPWYYPSSRKRNAVSDLHYMADAFSRYGGERLRDRYALLTVRALFASRQYGKCVEYFEKTFAKFPDSNLFKRMSMGYVAGCWARLGNSDKANRYFAKKGDFGSLTVDNKVAYMADANPDAAELLEYVQSCSEDSAVFCGMMPIARKVLKAGKARNWGDWEFALAYAAGKYRNDYKTASRHIRKALREKFSSEDLRDHAIAYKMKCDAANGNLSELLQGLKWFEGKTDFLAADANEWNRMLQNIIYVHYVPQLWKRKDFATAVLLCGYADNMLLSKRYERYAYYNNTSDIDYATSDNTIYESDTVDASSYYYYHEFDVVESRLFPKMRDNKNLSSRSDYSNLSFQLMNSLSSSQLINVYRRMAANTPLYRHLRKYARTDRNYIYELAGTLAIREENYRRAAAYLSQVSEKYRNSLNTCNYLKRDPFFAYPTAETYDNIFWTVSPGKAKLKFAMEMLRYQQEMKTGKTADERGLARLKYALGRRNSLGNCWALTQYWRGECIPELFIPQLQYWDEMLTCYNFLDDGETQNGFGFRHYNEYEAKDSKSEKLYKVECKKALAMLRSDEAKAKAQCILNNFKTVTKRYPSTAAARRAKENPCDTWRTWL